MKSSEELANRFQEVIFSGTWVANTNYRQELTGLSWETATTPLPRVNTIAALVQHLHYYLTGVTPVLTGGSLTIKDQFSFDFSPIRSQEHWEQVLATFFQEAEKFSSGVSNLPEARLQEVFGEEKYGTYQRNIEAMIEHSYYHLGQIVLIKKLVNRI
ncbi:DinB family protein [Hymenobacter tenuis]